MRGSIFTETRTSAELRGELFGVHIPELQLSDEEYRLGMSAAGLSEGERYLELGSGHGRGLVIAAREFGAVAVGVEYLDSAIEKSEQAAKRARVDDRVELIRADLQRIDPTPADVVHMHLGPAFHDILAARMEKRLQQTARVIAAGWKVSGWLDLATEENSWASGYIYRPGDPRLHVTESHRERDGRVELIDLAIHADLEAIELRVTSDHEPAPNVALSATNAWRGQELSLAVGITQGTTRIELWARSRSGRFTQRGPTLEVRANM